MSDGGNECDVLVAGSGLHGLTAALAASDLGLRVIVLEKTAIFGGGTIASGGRESAEVLRAVRDRGVTLLSESRAHRLTVESGRVVGVALEDGRSFTARQQVVIATGGYESDPILTHRFEDIPGLRSLFPSGATGDGLRMGGSAGARVHLVRNNLNITLVDDDSAIVDLTRPGSRVVNRFGNRFANEAEPDQLAASLRIFDARSRTFTNLPCRLVFDDDRPAIDLHPTITSSAGLATDNEDRILNSRGQAIPGLYAVGRVAVRSAS
jgi:succinate dehydrogenase/fumarate reductase flavoprotein subunit